MKIVHVALACFYYDGFEYQENLLPYFHKKSGNDVTIIASTENMDKNTRKKVVVDPSNYVNEKGIPVIRLKTKLVFGLKVLEGLYEELDKLKADIVFVHGSQASDALTISKYANNNPYVKVFMDNHADEINSINGIKSKIIHYTLFRYFAYRLNRVTDINYGVTQGRCEFMNKYYGIKNDKIELLIMGANDDKLDYANTDQTRKRIRNELNLKQDDFLFVTGGKIDNKKNIHILIDAFKEIKDKKVKLLIFGSIEKDMKEIIESKLGNENVIFIGWINSEKVYDYFFASDVMIFPGTHSVLWEQACATGIPCVFKYWEGITHMDFGGNCLLLRKADKAEIMYTMIKLYKDNDEYEKIKDVAQKVKGNFRYSTIAKKSIESKLSVEKVHYIANYRGNSLNRNLIVSPAGETKMEYIISALCRIGYDVNVLSTSESNSERFRIYKSYTEKVEEFHKIKYLSSITGKSYFIQRIARLWNKMQIYNYLMQEVKDKEIVIVYHDMSYLKVLQKVLEKRNIKLVFEVEEIYNISWGKDEFSQLDEINYLQNASGYILVNNLIGDLCKFDSKPTAIAYGAYFNGSESSKFIDINGIKHIVYAGVIEDIKKGAFLAVEAAQYLDDNYIMHVLGFGSKGSVEKLKVLISKVNELRGKDDSVIFHGRLEGDEYNDFLKECSIGLSTHVETGSYADYTFPSKILVYLKNNIIPVSSPVRVVQKSTISNDVIFSENSTPVAIAKAIMNIDYSKYINRKNILTQLDSSFLESLKRLISRVKENEYDVDKNTQ